MWGCEEQSEKEIKSGCLKTFCHSFNHILEFNEMNEREGRKRFILRMNKRNDCFGGEGD